MNYEELLNGSSTKEPPQEPTKEVDKAILLEKYKNYRKEKNMNNG